MSRLATILFLPLALFAAGPGWAQFPTRPIRMFVTVPPGAGAPDITARTVADALGKRFGRPVIVENRPGANGNVAAEHVAHAPADGYTLLLAPDALLVINPHLYKMTFDPMKDLAPVASLVSNQLVLTLNPELPARSLAELVAYAKTAKPPLAYGSSGVGSQQHLAMEMLKKYAGIPDMLHIPYKGATELVTGMLAGENMLGFSGSASSELVRSGHLRGLAVTGTRRSPSFPDLPTIGESYPGYSVEVWLGLFAPANTPEPVLATLREAVGAVLQQPDTVKRLQSAGNVEVLTLPQDAFRARIRDDYDKYGVLIRDLDIKAR